MVDTKEYLARAKQKFAFLEIDNKTWNVFNLQLKNISLAKDYQNMLNHLLRKHVMSKGFINDYLSKCKSSYEVLEKFSKIIEELKFQVDLDRMIKFISGNHNLFNAVEEFGNLNINKIKQGNAEEITGDKNILQMLDAYAVLNNVEIEIEDFSDNDFLPYLDSMGLFKQYVGNLKLLTLEEEQELLKDYLIFGDDSAKEKLVLHNWKLIMKFAVKYFYKNKIPMMDLFQDGCVGFLKAIEKYKFGKNSKLSTYAIWWVRREILNSIYERQSLIRKPIYLVQHYHKLLKIIEQFESENARSPEIFELIQLTGWSKSFINKLMNLTDVNISLNKTITTDTEEEFGNIIPDDSSFFSLENAEISVDVKKLLEDANLTERELFVITLRLGLDGQGVRTLESIAKMINLTRERVRQIEARVYKKLRLYKNIKDYAIYMEIPEKAYKYIDEFKSENIDRRGRPSKNKQKNDVAVTNDSTDEIVVKKLKV